MSLIAEEDIIDNMSVSGQFKKFFLGRIRCCEFTELTEWCVVRKTCEYFMVDLAESAEYWTFVFH